MQDRINDGARARELFLREQKTLAEQIAAAERDVVMFQIAASDEKAMPDARLDAEADLLAAEQALLNLQDEQRALQERINDAVRNRTLFIREQQPLEKQIAETEKDILAFQKLQNDEKAEPDSRLAAAALLLGAERALLGLQQEQQRLRIEQTERLGKTLQELAGVPKDTSALGADAKRIGREQKEQQRLFAQAARVRQSAEGFDESSVNLREQKQKRIEEADRLEARARAFDTRTQDEKRNLPGLKESEKEAAKEKDIDDKIKQKITAFFDKEEKIGIKVENLTAK